MAGLAMFSLKPNFDAAWMKLEQTLLPSPTQASLRPSMAPLRSWRNAARSSAESWYSG